MKTSAFIFKYTHIFAGIVLVGIFSLAGCGGDDDGEAVDTPATVPDLLNYEIRQVYDIYNTKLEINQGIDQDRKLVTIESTLLTGSYRRSPEKFTLLSSPVALMTVSATDFLDNLMSGQLNIFSLAVNKTFEWEGDSSPTSGEFDLCVGGVNRIRVTVNPDVNNEQAGEQAGVDITDLPDGVPISVTWEEFDGLFENEAADDYAQVASFAYGILRFIYEQGGLVIDSLEYLSENDLELEQNLSLFESCDPYPYATDQLVSDPGEALITWTDDSFDGSLGPGDSFLVFYTECWNDDETDNFDQLYHGTVNLVNYVEVEYAGEVTRIGFEPFQTPAGGIDFDNFEIIETQTDTNQQLVLIDEAGKLVLNGGFGMVFFTSP